MPAMQLAPHRATRLLRLFNWATAALGVAAILLGVLSMHATGSDHVAPAGPLAASSVSAPAATIVGVSTAGDHPATAWAHCDQTCVESILECALAIATCAALLLLVAFASLSHLPAARWSGRILRFSAEPWRLALPTPQPDLDQLSISRT
jgi:hypothetical protein